MALWLCLNMPCHNNQSDRSSLPGYPVMQTPPVAARSPTSPAARKHPSKYGLIGSDNTFTEQDDATAETSSEYLQSENEVYRYLDHDDDIVPCLDLSGEGIRLALIENCNLPELPIQTQNIPDPSRQLTWFRAM